jgi:hypothetical protein
MGADDGRESSEVGRSNDALIAKGATKDTNKIDKRKSPGKILSLWLMVLFITILLNYPSSPQDL